MKVISEIEFKLKYFSFHPKTTKIIHLSKKIINLSLEVKFFDPFYLFNFIFHLTFPLIVIVSSIHRVLFSTSSWVLCFVCLASFLLASHLLLPPQSQLGLSEGCTYFT